MRYLIFKSLIDRFVALVALLFFLPLFLLVALLVRWRLGSPVLFRQERPGYLGKPFWLLKFRTMTNACDSYGALLPDAQRLTPLGRWLRSTSIDELPELLNILQGEMSFIGPRPLLMEYLPLYSDEHSRRHDVRPGLSGWAQINGRNSITWEERFDLDVWYVDNRGFLLDVKIFCISLINVLRRRDVEPLGCATMPPFAGGRKE